MDARKRKRLEAAGYRFGDYGDFLGLTDDEREEVELRLALSRAICQLRDAQGLNRRQLAARLKTSQSRAARIEMGSVEASLDQLFHALFSLGGRLSDLDLSTSPARKRSGKGKAAKRSKPRKRMAAP
ncbi:MAG TPA: XRE family transcriptional regulator [Fimbriiglobus sp.]|nr:XRE family transcriptional regulator [Fimbriiglobus sp.]